MPRCVVCGLIVMLCVVSAACAEVATTRPTPGVTFERVVQNDPPLKYFVVTVDLGDPRVHLKVMRGSGESHLTRPWETTLMPVSQMAERDGVSIAVNGNLFMAKTGPWIFGRRVPYFLGNTALACGWAMSGGVVYKRNPADRDWPSLIVNDRGEVRIGRFNELPGDAREVVSGVWQVVTDGRNTAPETSDDGTPIEAAPRTGAAIDRSGKKLILLVADGRRPDYSVGMTPHRLGDEMIARGAWDAIALDGGGSSTLVMRDGSGKIQLVNRPSDGHDLPMEISVERSVANALGVVINGTTTRADH
jgi:exopolysaccharide biosynthesis protein